jgi:hypothetical protein
MQNKRYLSDEDIIAIKEAISPAHSCRFHDVEHEDLLESVKFYKNMNKVLNSSGGIIAKTLLVLLTTGIAGIFIVGLLYKLKTTATSIL